MKLILIGRRLMIIVPLLLSLAIAGCGGPAGFQPSSVEGGGPTVTSEGVLFTFIDQKVKRINIVGDFNNWSTSADPLFDRAGDGTWTIRIPLQPGRYEYKYLIDGKKWTPDPWNPDVVDDGFGGLNSVILVE
jgi:hypothetical protein